MRLFISSSCSSPLARLGSLSGASRLQPMLQCCRRMSSETSGASHSASTGSSMGGLTAGPWDANNRIRVLGATFGVIGAVGMLFDTFYRRATKQELAQVKQELTQTILHSNQHTDAKIDGLTNALLHTNQRDKIAAETEVRELRRENERLKGKGAKI